MVFRGHEITTGTANKGDAFNNIGKLLKVTV